MTLKKMAIMATRTLVAPEGVTQMRELVYCPLETMATWIQMTQLYVLQKCLGGNVLTAY